MPSQTERPRLGLRERKKAGTRAAIQRHALRLFREQGYEATTVGQIAGAADISESTFFRYFPTKEDVVRWDEFDPLLVEAIRAQPAGADQLSGPLRLLSDVMAERAGRQLDEFAVRTLVGAALGVCVSVMFAAEEDAQADVVVLLDRAMAQLEAGLPM